MGRKLTPEEKRIRALERALRELLDYMGNHRCPYCGTNQCAITVAEEAVNRPPDNG